MEVFINAWKEECNSILVNIETFVIIYVFKVAKLEHSHIKVVFYDVKPDEPLIDIHLLSINFEITKNIPEVVNYCKWPVLYENRNLVCGLCSVSRRLLQSSSRESIRQLLGFREACLVACAESSIWTKFCEVDIVSTIKRLLSKEFLKGNTFTIPHDIIRFEHHLSKPVKIHNFYKLARKNCNDKSIQSGVPKDNLNVLHSFAEGPYMTLADHILYPCYKIFFASFPSDLVDAKLPLTLQWFKNVEQSEVPELNIHNLFIFNEISELIEPLNINNESLYKSDPTRSMNVNHTKQYKIDDALEVINDIRNKVTNDILPYGYEILFHWENIPLEINPNGGALPAKRADRKLEQLENLAKAVIKLARDENLRIIDFCSGSGHLGILLAFLLPNCEIILVENKEKSLARAEDRIRKLNLQNVIMVQANLDYFRGKFDIGVSLHACGVATDMVMKTCIENKAHFVSCPCCYGSVKICHQLSYPRSKIFQKLFKNVEDSYFDLAHAADQTHEENNCKTIQGYQCMDVIDTDRKLYAEEYMYKVHLGKLYPTSCTNKNNLLVGVFNDLL